MYHHYAILGHVFRVQSPNEQLVVCLVDGVAALEGDNVGVGGQRGANLSRRFAREDPTRARG